VAVATVPVRRGFDQSGVGGQLEVVVAVAAVSGGDQSPERGVQSPTHFGHAQSLFRLTAPASGHDATQVGWTAAGRQQRPTRLYTGDHLPYTDHPRTVSTSLPGSLDETKKAWQNAFSFREARPPDPLTRGSAPGQGLCP